MTLRVVFRRVAKSEFEDAAVWYDDRRFGLGDEFVHEIEQAIAKAAAAPQRYPVVFGDIRRTVARRFPFSVYFRVVRTRWSSSRCFTVAETRLSGSAGNNDRGVEVHCLLAQFQEETVRSHCRGRAFAAVEEDDGSDVAVLSEHAFERGALLQLAPNPDFLSRQALGLG